MTKKSSYEYITLKGDDLEGLLPCPWCGEFSEDKQNFLAKVTDKQGWKSIQCDGCGINPTFCVHTWEEVTRLWNSRVDFNDSQEFMRGVESYRRHLLDLITDMDY